MPDRRSAGVLALIGALLLGLGCWLPYERVSGQDYELFQHTSGYAGQLYFAVEPAAVMVVAAVIGLMLMRTGLSAGWPAVLIATGCQTVLMWVGYVGYTATGDFGADGAHLRAGAWLGVLGSLAIAAAGVVALRASAGPGGAPTPPGWYADPTGGAGLRYWSGSTWTEHTAEPPAGS
jgi:hypothetical protein